MIMKKNKIVLIAAVCLCLSIISAIGYNAIKKPAPEPISEPSSSEITEEPIVENEPDPELEEEVVYPLGKFGPDPKRLAYESEAMILRVPDMDFEGPVFSGIEDITPGSPSYQSVANSTLKHGVALFGASQLPSASNSNVSIAGHRDIDGSEFYKIDKVEIGSYIYLEYEGKEYVYICEEIVVTDPNDWEQVRIKDYSRVTLQSCTPINIASHRIFVIGRLQEINDLQ